MKELKFTLTIDDANTILSALGKMPFSEVYPLINKINEQTQSQLDQDEHKNLMKLPKG